MAEVDAGALKRRIAAMPAWTGSSGATGGAIVIGGDYRGLGIVRSLGRQGIPVWVLTDQHMIAGFSRYARRRSAWPSGDEEQQVRYLLETGRRHGLEGWVLFPTGDDTSRLVSRHHAKLRERYRLTTPDWETLKWAYDKRLSNRLASEVGVAHPWTRYPRGSEDVASLECSFPVILKPAVKDSFNPFTLAKAWRVENREELVARYQEACRMVQPEFIMIQEMIPGGGSEQFAYAALCLDGRPVASVVARRSRQFPFEFGRSSSFVETVENPQVEIASASLLRAIRFTGLVEVEFKRDPRSGEYKLLDVNPRVWGWHSIGRRAGVDFPYMAWRLAHGEVPSEERRAKPGVRWVRGVTDLPAVVQELRRGSLSLSRYVGSLRGSPLESAIFAADDPLPALLELPLLVHLAWRRGAI